MRHCLTLGVAVVFLLAVLGTSASAQNSFLGPLDHIGVLSSTVPANGDVNPYGVFRVPVSSGKLLKGHILVSNFNNGANSQGTGHTIVDIAPDGTHKLFAEIDPNHLPGRCPGGVGLTTALVVLRTGWVIVGSLPTSNGMSPTAKAGCLLSLNNQGRVVATFSGGPINGPWDMTVFDGGNLAALFVTNVLNGTVAASPNVVHKGTVVRIIVSASPEHMPRILLTTVIGSGFAERTDPAALVVGPTGLALNADNDKLFVADSANNRIASISNPLSRRSSAGVGATVSQRGAINDPLGLTRAPNGNLIAANGGNGNLVEITPSGAQIAHKLVDKSGSPPGAGALFGLTTTATSVVFVDDATNTLNVLHR